jgi:hypothetical protein
VAVDPDYIYTWNSATKTVYVYDQNGNSVRTMTLPNGNYSYSLSFVDGLLFVAVDGNYSTGTWYGYNIRKGDLKSAVVIESSGSAGSNRIHDSTD